MRLRWLVLLAVLLGLVRFAPAQSVISPIPEGPTPGIAWPGEQSSSAGRLWAAAEYLLWWTKSAPLPVPLVTTSNTADFGVIGAPSTRLLIGNENLDFGTRNGGRFTLGGWMDDEQRFGLEGSFFFLGSSSVHQGAAVDGLSPRLISVPFIDETPGGTFGDPTSVHHENGFVFGAPINIVTGTGFAGIATLSVTDQLSGAEANGLLNVLKRDNLRVDVLGGFRYVYFREKLQFNTSSPTVVPQIPGEFFVTSDSFDGRTDFYGGQIGGRVAWSTGDLTVAATGKVALGVMDQRLGINGSFSTNDFNIPFGTGPGRTFPGGYFALPSNMGEYHRDRFGVVPEAGVQVSYQLTQHLSLSLGYTFLYLNSVVRPGDQIDRTINGGQSALYASTPTPPGLQGGLDRPEPLFRSTDFWAQGISFGFEFRY